ncbi:hypothetical protein BJV78DRAFT_1174206 [Lactifluus subvellereus]|nr:hypothetical protein BJV78DRAFT_1174206 [Lactifluus subvellereus]
MRLLLTTWIWRVCQGRSRRARQRRLHSRHSRSPIFRSGRNRSISERWLKKGGNQRQCELKEQRICVKPVANFSHHAA